MISIVKGDAAGISLYARLAGLIFLVLLDFVLVFLFFMHCDFYHLFERIFHAI